ncbi:MAG: DUF2878 domain-containing protein [Pseudomonadota bacterium]
MSKQTLFILYNFIGFQAVWAACAYGSINGSPLLGVYAAAVYILIHFVFSKSKTLDLIVMLSVAIVGILLDSLNAYIGIITFNHESNLLPLWLMTLWLCFALILPHSLFWLNKYPLIAVFLGGIGGSGSYFIGHQLGAISLSDSLLTSLSVYFIEWAIIIPVAFWLIKRVKDLLVGKRHTHST